MWKLVEFVIISVIATSQLPERTVSVWLLLTYLSSSSSQTRMKTIQALCVSSPSNPWRPSQPTPTPPPHPTAKTPWSSTGRWVCTHKHTHTRIRNVHTPLRLYHSQLWGEDAVLTVQGRAKTRTSSSWVTQIHTVQYSSIQVFFIFIIPIVCVSMLIFGKLVSKWLDKSK